MQRHKILIVDDAELNRTILADMLGDEFEILEAEDGLQAIACLQKHSLQLSLLLLDITMPNIDGFQVLATMNQRHWIDEIPVIMISAETVPGYVERAYDLGVTDYINRPFDARIVRRRVINTIMLYAKQRQLTSMLAEQIYEKEKNSNLMIEILSNLVEFRNGESGLHVLHIHVLTELLLKQLLQMTDRYPLPSSSIALISNASALHDIGKIAIPEDILNKPGRLTAQEFETVKTHSEIGASMLDRLPLRQHEPLVRTAYEICRWHHERYDGRGYPDGLVGDAIPISAQIVSLADVYDALTSRRVYKQAYSHQTAMAMILGGECGVFNPLLLECLTQIADRIPGELHEHLSEKHTKIDLGAMAQELLQSSAPVADTTIHLLEHERTKYQFFTSTTQEIQFEVLQTPQILTISEWGARKLGLSEVILSPATSPELAQVISQEDYQAIRKLVHSTTPDAPIAEYHCFLTVAGVRHWSTLVLCSMWSRGDRPEYTGSIGKILDVQRERSQLPSMEALSSRDVLTSLHNKSYVKKQIDLLLATPERPIYAMALLDLDHLRKANRLHGHLFGDNILKYVADQLRKTIRGFDLAARVGGDEFLVFTQCDDPACPQIDRIFQALSAQNDQLHITFSMGVALSYTGQESTFDTLFRQADHVLQLAKQGGGNRYRFFDPEGQALTQPRFLDPAAPR